MNEYQKRKRSKKPRVRLTDDDLKRLYNRHGTDSAAELARRTALPYMLVYNIIHRRALSVSNRHYEILFGGPPPSQVPLKIDGSAFRAMVRLWLFIDNRRTRADLYRDLFDLLPDQKIDHRIFSGKIGKVDARLEHAMRSKFAEAGIDGQLLDEWLAEFEDVPQERMVPFARIRPILTFLKQHLGMHPQRILKQSISRYESGELRQVSRQVFEHAVSLKRKTERALGAADEHGADRLRETVIGGKPGYTLYADIEEELSFLCRYAGTSARRYLGRSLWTYTHGKAKRISNARAQKIRDDVDHFIRHTPHLALNSLPTARYRSLMQGLMGVLLDRISRLLTSAEGIRFEKEILKPVSPRGEYNKPAHGFTPFDMASGKLGMKRKAFDLMVAGNCEIFRTVGSFKRRWYLSDLYLEELSGKKEFRFVSAKYEGIAKRSQREIPPNRCMH